MKKKLFAFILVVLQMFLIYVMSPPIKAYPLEVILTTDEYEKNYGAWIFVLSESGWLSANEYSPVFLQDSYAPKIWRKKLTHFQIERLNELSKKVLKDGEESWAEGMLSRAFVKIIDQSYNILYGGARDDGTRCVADLVSEIVRLSPVKTGYTELEKERAAWLEKWDEKERLRLEEERRSREELQKVIDDKVKWPDVIK